MSIPIGSQIPGISKSVFWKPHLEARVRSHRRRDCLIRRVSFNTGEQRWLSADATPATPAMMMTMLMTMC